ncbi:right-handed parallel beta-helix repeat-containing protein [Chryseobacterium profundimaris]|uniref:Right handed beta helix region n=1 Tax=Chryseobacterium profundimaris TaxID=1387275 RepID=A0ABY1NRJ9_9FLAO|nr:right-handed parallel beta-helix repeat-containing protein [Chryseobacterium profundimaris]SMP16404.1 Right handed beta helix region [Chryseobacterium profundimaris]
MGTTTIPAEFVKVESVNDLETISTLEPGDFLFRKKNDPDKLYKMDAETFYQVLNNFARPISPSDTGPFTADRWYKPSVSTDDPGTTYTNAGNLTAKNGYDTLFWYNGTTWTKTEVKLPTSTADGKVQLGDTKAVNGTEVYNKTLTIEATTVAAGKNLFDKNKVIIGKRIVTATGADFDDPTAAMTMPIPVKGNTVYYPTGINNGLPSYNYRFLDAAGNYLHAFSGSTEDTDFAWSKSGPIRSHPNAVAMQLVFRQANQGTADTVQVEEGSTATTYEPYKYKIKSDLLDFSNIASLYLNKGNYIGTAQTLYDLINTNKIDSDAKSLLNSNSINSLITSFFTLENDVNEAAQLAQSAFSLTESRIPSNEKGVPGGVATLGSNGKVLASQLDLTGQVLKGEWNPTTNTPTLVNGTGTVNNYYLVTADGSIDLGAGLLNFKKGDTVIYSSEGKWLRNSKPEIPNPVTDTTLSDTTQFLRINNGLFNLFNDNTKEYVSYKKVETYPNGLAISDANIDGNLYRKVGSEYFVQAEFLKTGNVDLKTYGCKADGISDDAALFQKLIDFLNLIGGGVIHLPFGKVAYYNTYLIIKDNISIKGKGVGSSFIAPISTNTSNSVGGIYNITQMSTDGSVWNPIKNVVFEDFTMDCSGLHNIGTSNVGRKGFFILGMENCHFNRVIVYKSIGTGIGCDFLSRTSIKNCLAVQCGMYLGDGVAAEIGQSGIGIGSCSREDESVVVEGNWCINNGNYGIFVEIQVQAGNPDQPQARYAKIVNNHCYGNKYGIGNKGSGNAQISGNTCYNNKEHGIYLNQGQRAGNMVFNNDCGYNLKSGIAVFGSVLAKNNGDSVHENWCHHNGEYGIYSNNAAVANPFYNTEIHNNRVYNNGYAGIFVNYNCYYYSVVGNKVWNNGQKGVTTANQGIQIRQSVGNIVKDNIVYDNQATKTQIYGIRIYKKQTTDIATSIEIKDNSLIGYDYANAIYYESGVDYIIKNNTGFENKLLGEAVFVDGSDTLAISTTLFTSPKAVIVTPKGSGNVWVENVTSSGFTVRRGSTTGILGFYWNAEV